MRGCSLLLLLVAQPCVCRVRCRRAVAGDTALCRKLSELAMSARNVIETEVLNDLAARMRYYEEARDRKLTHVGGIILAEDALGEILGWADVGLTLFDARSRRFELPKRPEGLASIGPSQLLTPRPYISNLAVGRQWRRRGVGAMLVRACEQEAQEWALSQAVERYGGSPGGMEDGNDVWLEVSLSNRGALALYRTLGYEQVGESSGREIVRGRWTMESTTVQRGVMRKSMSIGTRNKRDGSTANAHPQS